MMKKPVTQSNHHREATQGGSSAWARHHLDSAKSSLLRLVIHPIASLLTWLVIATALTLPTLFYLALSALEQQVSQWQASGQITLYLNQAVSEQAALSLSQDLADRPEIMQAQYISKAEAWQSLSQLLALPEQTSSLQQNPLPASIVLVPSNQNSLDIEALTLLVNGLPEVDEVQLDLEWLERLNRFFQFIRSLVLSLALLLGLAVLLVVGNTIRLAVESRKQDIRIISLLGATDAFIRRPFVYLGVWYGLFGGLAAWLLVTFLAWWLHQPLDAFLQTYGLTADRVWLSMAEAFSLIGLSIAVSVIGTHLALWRHLRDAEPS